MCRYDDDSHACKLNQVSKEEIKRTPEIISTIMAEPDKLLQNGMERKLIRRKSLSHSFIQSMKTGMMILCWFSKPVFDYSLQPLVPQRLALLTIGLTFRWFYNQ